MKYIIASLSLACLLLIGGTASAQEAGSILLQNSVEVEELYTDDSGVQRVRRVPVSKVVPGDKVIYTITFTNVGEEPAQDVTITNPVPAHMHYVDRSAFGPGTDISFSVDGGNTYGSPQELFVTSSEGEQRSAAAEDYTHIRWVLRNEARPGSKGSTSFKAVLQ